MNYTSVSPAPCVKPSISHEHPTTTPAPYSPWLRSQLRVEGARTRVVDLGLDTDTSTLAMKAQDRLQNTVQKWVTRSSKQQAFWEVSEQSCRIKVVAPSAGKVRRRAWRRLLCGFCMDMVLACAVHVARTGGQDDWAMLIASHALLSCLCSVCAHYVCRGSARGGDWAFPQSQSAARLYPKVSARVHQASIVIKGVCMCAHSHTCKHACTRSSHGASNVNATTPCKSWACLQCATPPTPPPWPRFALCRSLPCLASRLLGGLARLQMATASAFAALRVCLVMTTPL